MNVKHISLLLVTLVTLFACNNNEEVVNPRGEGLQVNADFLRLSDNNNTTAGSLVIHAGVPEVTVKWNTGSLCNLDTTQTTLKLSKGTATLPIRWMGKLEAGTYGPEGVAFKAGVQIIAGKESLYVPLVWADKIDSTEIMKSAAQTRAAGDIMPRVAQISMIPLTVNMNDVNGGSMYIGLTDVPFAILDVSEITSDLNIDMTKIPNYITTSQMLDFKWTAAGAPAFGFSARIVAMSEGLSPTGTITFSKGGGGVTPPKPEKFTVLYNANGGTGSTVDSNSPYDSGTTVTVLNNAFTPPTGMTFNGWSTTATGGTAYAPGSTFQITENVTLYATWSVNTIVPQYGGVFYMWDAPIGQTYWTSYPNDNTNISMSVYDDKHNPHYASRSAANTMTETQISMMLNNNCVWQEESNKNLPLLYSAARGRAGAWLSTKTKIPMPQGMDSHSRPCALTTWANDPSVIAATNGDPQQWLIQNAKFFPANGCISGSQRYYVGRYCCFWGNTCYVCYNPNPTSVSDKKWITAINLYIGNEYMSMGSSTIWLSPNAMANTGGYEYIYWW